MIKPSIKPTAAILTLKEYTFLAAVWIQIAVASIYSMPSFTVIFFLTFVLIINALSPIAGIALLIVLFHTPNSALMVPGGAFTWAVVGLLPHIWQAISSKRAFHSALPPPALAAVVCGIYALCSFFILDDSTYFLKYASYYLQGALICAGASLIVQSFSEALSLIKVWAISALMAILIKGMHLYFGSDTALFEYLSYMDASSEFDLGQRVSVYAGGGFVQRMIWPGDEPNYASGLLILGLCFSMALARYEKGKRLLWLFCSGLILIQIAGTYSRSGLIAAVVLIAYHVLRGGRAFLGLGVVSALSGLFAYILYPPFQDRVASIMNDSTGSGAIRLEFWDLGLEEWSQSPIFGNGLSSYVASIGWMAHNTYLQLLSELGIFGLILWVAVPFSAIAECIKNYGLIQSKVDRDFLFDVGAGIIPSLLMIATITLHDMKIFWLACLLTYFLARTLFVEGRR